MSKSPNFKFCNFIKISKVFTPWVVFFFLIEPHAEILSQINQIQFHLCVIPFECIRKTEKQKNYLGYSLFITLSIPHSLLMSTLVSDISVCAVEKDVEGNSFTMLQMSNFSLFYLFKSPRLACSCFIYPLRIYWHFLGVIYLCHVTFILATWLCDSEWTKSEAILSRKRFPAQLLHESIK